MFFGAPSSTGGNRQSAGHADVTGFRDGSDALSPAVVGEAAGYMRQAPAR